MKLGREARILLISLSSLLIFNAVLVVFREQATYAPGLAGEGGRSVSCNCSSVARSVVTPHPRPTVNYSILLATERPPTWILNTENATYSRLGVELKINYAQSCPKGSLMLDNRWKNYIPEHFDCPILFIVGARKGGSTSLYTYVSRHANFEGILLDRGPSAGETFYFSANYDRESWGDWSRYTKMFEHVNWYMTGECSVGNLVNCRVPKRIWTSCGKQAKIVMLLRDPIQRLESNYLMRVDKGTRHYNNNTRVSTAVEIETQTFISAALKRGLDMQTIDKSWEKFRCLFAPSRNLIFEGIYYAHVMNWLCNFPPENILILNSEEFYDETPKIFEQVLKFLGLASLDHETRQFITSTIYNKGTGVRQNHQQMSELDRKKLKAIYKYSNQALFELLDWNHIGWN